MTIEKLSEYYVSKANPPWNLTRKIEAIMGFKFAKKNKKKINSSSADKETFWTPHLQKKHAEPSSTDSKLRFLSISGHHTRNVS